MEDSNDKLRRNLVVLSISIIFYVFLNPQFSEKGGLGFDLKSLDLSKSWICIAFVFIYVFLRFFHSIEAENDRKSIYSEFCMHLRNLTLVAFDKDLLNCEKKIAFRYFDAENVENAMKTKVFGFGDDSLIVFKKFSEYNFEDSEAFSLSSGWVRLSAFFGVNDHAGEVSVNNEFKYNIELPYKIVIYIKSLLKMHFFGKSFVNIIFPYFVAIFAFSLIVVKCLKLNYDKFLGLLIFF